VARAGADSRPDEPSDTAASGGRAKPGPPSCGSPAPAVGRPQPIDAYAVSKHAAESLALVIARRHGINLSTARIFNVIGPGQDERHLRGWLARQCAGITKGEIKAGALDTTRTRSKRRATRPRHPAGCEGTLRGRPRPQGIGHEDNRLRDSSTDRDRVPRRRPAHCHFYHPDHVVCDQVFLSALPDRDITCGIAEAIKIFAIADADALAQHGRDLAAWCPARRAGSMADVVWDALRWKLALLAADPYEESSRRSLNYGHAFAHWFEEKSDYALSHGEAVLWAC
jgi:hypothetical protein